ncbi:SpoIIE family protein phosphatase [Microcoleus sp. ARI1-A5]|uniref:SpoIIE family protein phosphatase n=1 Tax=unclassified Microcoleus TaxID=2642155 RepID=UPI003FA5E63B
MKNTSRKLRLRTALVVPFVLQIVAAVGLVGYLSFRNGQKAVDDLATQLSNQVSSRVSQQLSNYLATPQQVNGINAQAIDLGMLNPQDFDTTRRFFWREMKLSEKLSDIVFCSQQGECVALERGDDGSLYTERIEAPDVTQTKRYSLDQRGNLKKLLSTGNWNPREDGWYKNAVAGGKPTWNPIHQWVDRPDIISVVSTYPVYDSSKRLRGVLTVDFILSQISDFLRNLHISSSGKIVIMERDGMIIGSSSTEKSYREVDGKAQRLNIFQSQEPLLRESAQQLRDRFGTFGQISSPQMLSMKINNEKTFVSVTPWQDKLGINWVVVLVIPESDFMGQIEVNTRNTILLCLAALALAIVLGVVTARSIARPVLRLTKAAEEIAAGNLDNRVDTTDFIEIQEIHTLEHSFNSMAGQLKESFETLEDKVKERTAELATANEEIIVLNQRLKEENLRMGAELDIVRQMQQMILPKAEELKIEGLDIAAYMDAADEVGGDYYDVLNTDGVVTLGIGDVTGHGLESGILMLMAQTAVRTLKEIRETDPVRFLDALNRTLYKNVQRMKSEKSLTLAILNYSEGWVSISGQHEETIIVRLGGEIERVDTMDLGFPIALDDDIAEFISQISIELHPGEGIVLYTDGIPEAKDIKKKQYGVEPMCEVISKNWHLSAGEIKQAVIDDVRRHIGRQKVFDDITLLVLKRTELGVEKKSQPQAAALV